MDAVLLACLAGACFGALAVAVRIGLRRATEPALAPLATIVVASALVAVVAAATGSLRELTLADAWPFIATGAAVPGLSYVLFVAPCATPVQPARPC